MTCGATPVCARRHATAQSEVRTLPTFVGIGEFCADEDEVVVEVVGEKASADMEAEDDEAEAEDDVAGGSDSSAP